MWMQEAFLPLSPLLPPELLSICKFLRLRHISSFLTSRFYHYRVGTSRKSFCICMFSYYYQLLCKSWVNLAEFLHTVEVYHNKNTHLQIIHSQTSPHKSLSILMGMHRWSNSNQLPPVVLIGSWLIRIFSGLHTQEPLRDCKILNDDPKVSA